MNRHRAGAEGLAVLAMVLAASVGIGAFGIGVVAAAGEPRVTEAVLGQDRKELPSSYEIVNPTAVFRPDAPRIVCVFKVEGAKVGTTVKSVWIAENVGKAAPPNYKIDEKSLALPFINTGSFSLSKPNKGWPVGTYRLEIYMGSTLAKTLKFSVRPQ
jgi:hypothetical protein